MTEHPILFYFGETDKKSFPLIAVIAREANSDLPIVQKAGQHDFRDYPYPKAQPWHMAYALVAECVGLTEKELKSICIKRNESPLIFANAHEIGIPANITSNEKLRLRNNAVSNAPRHIETIFSLSDLTSRINLVIASGLNSPQFESAKIAISQECFQKNIPVIEIPFFFMPNKLAINSKITNDNREQIQEIVNRFLDSDK